ncbi:hypothetical protein IL992_24720 [Microbispora sp. NEAU-D428]|uniref:hypothetical protein n=1 Tax=Microbispora sitophila TaxID=2771537 RepID=UPI001867C402|nr:hypothetical protein [Microbispora sitophila]MBE3012370.1 hypothetical protein [Microbispora sitophila]
MRDRLQSDRNHLDMVPSAPQAAWLGHPATVAAIGVLIVNDRVLKPQWPGVLTGKLSDLAGMLVAPPLPALLAAYAAGIARRDVARARVLAVLPAAVFAVTATSAVPASTSAQAVEVRDGEIVVMVRDRSAIASEDGGRSWHEWKDSPSPSSSPATRACVPAEPRRCYRVIPGRLGVEQTTDGGATWTVAWEISRGGQGWLDRVYENPDPLGERSGPAASLAVAVQAVPGGHVVAVANGTDGVALRDVSGRWRRPPRSPPSSCRSWAGVRACPTTTASRCCSRSCSARRSWSSPYAWPYGRGRAPGGSGPARSPRVKRFA